jgi:REP element-mobilizing transposase RayT
MKKSLAHTAWECKYHIVWCPKNRRKVIYGKLKRDIGQILRKLCEYKGVEVLEGTACADHIHVFSVDSTQIRCINDSRLSEGQKHNDFVREV